MYERYKTDYDLLNSVDLQVQDEFDAFNQIKNVNNSISIILN